MKNESQEIEQQWNLRDSSQIKNQQELAQIYYCQCGKKFSLFLGLYTHFKRQHQARISSIRTQSNCTVKKVNGKFIITYLLKDLALIEKQESQEIINNNQNQWKQTKRILHQYIYQDNEVGNSHSNEKKMIMEMLVNYLEGVVLGAAEEYPLGIEHILLYYNDFIINYIPAAPKRRSISLITFEQTESELIKLWRWLLGKEYISSNLVHRIVLQEP